ncbi:GntR family transcriptional regulator [Staphylococcus chromogenes]|uniref:GntR family transcriptional regulator n=1 Tax=Staphylococcus chromogenes TaxID=46126 RepID=UPI000D1B724C|nr:GntR family transcriptional regulator [Staphylococcus chromogenes]PTF68450.1 GntR family transcriptional regulator [Staphylococcus chromogenes]PTG07268.1 GntR family transcriptional regulator [Staphylococcus chromogenes]PTG81843.1 GntR family transcriptional regulator [Staphylococcus chromogenes]PUZ19758.1 GntR family transcriptional regulator [Staphylococcus chromogenes]TRL27686.1 GntR family transcriptional regulator [Staphylococcus chromogenes]
MNIPENWLYPLSMGEKIASQIRLRIINGEYSEKTVLTENQIAKQFEVSRSPVRDAFKILNQEGLIQLERMGAEVKAFDKEKQQELTDIRLMIESFAFTKVIQHEDIEGLISKMFQTLEMMKVCIQFNDAAGFSEHDLLFHEHLVFACHHEALLNLWISIREKLLCVIYIGMSTRMTSDKADFERIIHNHQLYIEALQKRNKILMYEAFKANFNDLNDDIGAFWR